MSHPIPRVLLLPVLLAGCTQSLFDDSVANGSDPDIDGGVGSCAAPCLGDAVAEWNGQQGGTKGRVHFRDFGRKPGHDAAEMAAGQFMGVDGFLGRGTPQPAIVSCGDLGGAECAGLGDSLLLAPGQIDANGFDPAMELVAPVSGTLRVYGTFAAANDSPGGRQRLLVGRNARADLLFDGSYRPGEATGIFDLEVDALAGDRLALLSAPPLDGTAVPLGVHFFASELASAPKRCQLGLRFEDGPKDLCHDMMLERKSSEDSPVFSSTVASLGPDFGNAEHFVKGSYLQGATPMDYSGDFTIQFWMRVPEPPEFDSYLYGDTDCAAKGGLYIQPDNDGMLYVVGYWNDMNVDWCQSGMSAPVIASAVRPTDDQWHFFRITRSTTAGKLSICIDGSISGFTTVPADKNMTSGLAPRFGLQTFETYAYFAGDVDEFRILSRALPCQ